MRASPVHYLPHGGLCLAHHTGIRLCNGGSGKKEQAKGLVVFAGQGRIASGSRRCERDKDKVSGMLSVWQ